MSIKSFRDLDVYKDSYQLAVEVNKLLVKLPVFEKHLLIDQIRRASRSIPANLAEGWSRRISAADFKKHLRIAIGSCHEMEVHLEMTKDLSFLPATQVNDLLKRYQVLGMKLSKLHQNWQKH